MWESQHKRQWQPANRKHVAHLLLRVMERLQEPVAAAPKQTSTTNGRDATSTSNQYHHGRSSHRVSRERCHWRGRLCLAAGCLAPSTISIQEHAPTGFVASRTRTIDGRQFLYPSGLGNGNEYTESSDRLQGGDAGHDSSYETVVVVHEWIRTGYGPNGSMIVGNCEWR